ncbi:MAG: TetR family transcriptional regulator [Phenylobacterium sp.]|uniref:TetR/AcrR family transcriptional regulator n=1 Tax=Phenylobacterium sp. TaxID=1871053 RepID=UPI00272F3F4A|nr:TetR family transcriptional regulator [Phenylobacterium sp.]MDP2012451.1 TetR family transcriptional regulator [Phenylobacterium sp.]
MTVAATRPRGRPARTARPVEETRSAILDAALKLFSERGFEGAAMRDIAGLAGVEHSLLRYHYSDKATLWRAALARLITDMNAHMAAGWRTTRGQPPLDRFKATLRDYVRYCARHPEHARIMVQEAMGESDRVAWIAEQIVGPQHRALTRLLRPLMDQGHLPRVPLRNLIYMLSAAAQSPFTLAGEVRHAYGIDMLDKAEIEGHADALIALLIRN